MNWKFWLYGLIAAVIGGSASAASNFFVLPMVVNGISMHALLVATGWNAFAAALIALFAYLKNHPLPDWNGTERRNGV